MIKQYFMKYLTPIFLFALILAAASCNQQPAKVNQAPSTNTNINAAATNPKWDAYVEQFLKDYFDANPQFGAYQGKHEYDGRLADWSEDGLKKEIARLKSEREKVLAFKDGDLDERQRFERDYV
ncbi:MAG: hypothetical protein ABI999_15655, partial [Acidobacteriota bacterium]